MDGRVVVMLALALLARPSPARGVQVEALEPGRDWRVGGVEFRGNASVPAPDLAQVMVTKPRPWYDFWRFWRPLPEFDPITFRADLDRLRQLYRNRGFYEVRISHDIELPAGET
jgi:outer membrane protein assembly factor BamA